MNLNKHLKYNKGMTLVELIVVLAIFAIISAMVMFNYSDYKSNVDIKVLSDDIALSIRQAQAYAIGVKSVKGDAGTSFPGYGIHFNTDDGIYGASGVSTCNDDTDNDGDGRIDEVDPSCTGNDGNYDPNLLELPKNQIIYTCNDGTDNDGDNFMDAQDSSCILNGFYDPTLTELAKIISPYPACSDGDDNDVDGYKDIFDPECHMDGDPNNTHSYNPKWSDEKYPASYLWNQCSNKNDDESDGLMDYDDPQCHEDGNPNNIHSYNPNLDDEGTLVLPGDCGDGMDNDNDGSMDNSDRSCHIDFNSSNPSSYEQNLFETGVAQCNDSIDNDSDGLSDIDDPECHSDRNQKNRYSYNPMTLDENISSGLSWTQCIDGMDNNFNGLADYEEPNCHSDSDPNNPNSYNPNINDENDMNNVVFDFNSNRSIFKGILTPISKFVSYAKKVFADEIIPAIMGDSKSFVLFADISCDGNPALKGNNQYDYPNNSNATPCGMHSPDPAICNFYNVNAGAECMSITNIIGANKIYGICVNEECENGSIRKGTLDIVFTRPNPDASFCYKDIGMPDCLDSGTVSHAGVVIQSLVDGRVKRIVVWNTGQISVN